MGGTSRISLLLIAHCMLAVTARDNAEYYLKAQNRHNNKMDALKHRYDDKNANDIQKSLNNTHHHHHHHHHHDNTTLHHDHNDTLHHHHHHHHHYENGTLSQFEHMQPPLDIPHTNEKNVFEMELHPCSTEGMAMTGLNLDGRCAHHQFDGRSQPICIHVPSFPTFIDGTRVEEKQKTELRGGARRTSLYGFFFGHSDHTQPKEDNFFTLTGQPNWMSEHMPCTEDPKRKCPIQHWCVSEQAFSSFLVQAGGCRKIGTVLCEATNLKALETLEQDLADGGQGAGEDMKAALKCLQDMCWLR